MRRHRKRSIQQCASMLLLFGVMFSVNGEELLQSSQTVYVDAAKTDNSGDGLSWSGAKKSLAGAVSAAAGIAGPVEIIIRQGEYTGEENRNLTFSGNVVAVRGEGGADATIIDLDGADRFLFVSGSGNEFEMEGITLRNGNATLEGGLINGSSNAISVKNARIVNCTFTVQGGVISSDGGSIQISGSEFLENRMLFEEFVPQGGGGMIFANNANCTISDSIFYGNRAKNGAVLKASGNSNIVIDRSILAMNVAAQDGGVIYTDGANVSLTLNNSLLGGNNAGRAALIYQENSGTDTTINMVHCTVGGNYSANSFALVSNGVLNLKNSIYRSTLQVGTLHMLASCVWSPYLQEGTGSIAADPLLDQNGRLTVGSPCIDSANGSVALTMDLSGATRSFGAAADMGCYEYFTSTGESSSGNVLGRVPGKNLTSNLNLVNDSGTNIFLENDAVSGSSPANANGAATMAAAAPERTIYVDTGRPNDSGDGLTWATAKKTLASAVTASKSNSYTNIIMVKEGVYTGSSNQNLNFGGYNIQIKGEPGASVVIDLANGGSFLKLSGGETTDSKLINLTIKNGVAMNTTGGTIMLSNSSLELQDCTILNSITGNINYGSMTGNEIAPIYVTGSGRTIKMYRTKIRNGASLQGGGARKNAGAILLLSGASAEAYQCEFSGNASTFGATINVNGSGGSFKAEQTKFLGNRNDTDGGVISAVSGATVNLSNCLFYRNRAGNYGDLQLSSGSTATVVNCTFSGAIAGNAKSSNFQGTTTLKNSIFTGEIAVSGTMTATNNCTVSALTGTGNITGDPKLLGIGRLSPNSICINAGITTGAPTLDIDGTPRPKGNAVDIGCQEYFDTDGDGIPDVVETAANLSPSNKADGVGDKDGDGALNFEEYRYGTEILVADTDGDGFEDGWELTCGTNPAIYSTIVYVDAMRPNDSGNGLTESAAKMTIKGALSVAPQSGDKVILVKPGVYTGSNNSNLSLTGSDMKIIGLDRDRTIVDLNGNPHFLSITNGYRDSRLGNLTIRNANGSDSTSVINHGSGEFTLVNCVFEKNASFTGGMPEALGAIYVRGGTLYLENCLIRENVQTQASFISLTGGNIVLDSCRMIGNDFGTGHLVNVYSPSSTCKMINSIAMENNLRSTGATFNAEPGKIEAVNCSFVNNNDATKPTWVTIGTSAQIAAYNSVFTGEVSGNAPTLHYCCTDNNYSANGTGNFAADPKIVRNGYMMADSPCVDAGSNTYAPPTDIIGTLRPQGARADIGAEEFADSDGDGLSDHYEYLCGGNVDPNGDADGDGLTNLQELQLGTNALLADTDGDGIPDGWEVANGLDPLRSTDSFLDSDGDGLTDLEEFRAGTNIHSADSDGDGRGDYWEVKVAFTNPTSADFYTGSNAETVHSTQNGNNYVAASSKGFDKISTNAVSNARNGYLVYNVNFPGTEPYVLEVTLAQNLSKSSTSEFRLGCVVGTESTAEQTVTAPYGSNTVVRFMLPPQAAGTRAVKLNWSNVYSNTQLCIKSVKLVSLNGPATNGVKNWITSRLQNMADVTVPATSKISPVCVEGGNDVWFADMSVTGYYTGGGATAPVFNHLPNNGWYTNVPLNPSAATTFQVKFGTTSTVSKTVTWEATDIINTNKMTVRMNDSLKLGVPSTPAGISYTVKVGSSTYTVTASTPAVHKFTTAGTTEVKVSWTENSNPKSKVMMVEVDNSSFASSPVCYVRNARVWTNPNLSWQLHVDGDVAVPMTLKEREVTPVVYTLNPSRTGTTYVAARLAKDGPVVASQAIRTIQAASFADEGYNRILESYADGTVLFDAYIVMENIPDDIQITVTLWSFYACFSDGTREKTFTKADFDANNELHFQGIGSPNATSCQGGQIYQNGVLIANLY